VEVVVAVVAVVVVVVAAPEEVVVEPEESALLEAFLALPAVSGIFHVPLGFLSLYRLP
jgi:hypothetical protein